MRACCYAGVQLQAHCVVITDCCRESRARRSCSWKLDALQAVDRVFFIRRCNLMKHHHQEHTAAPRTSFARGHESSAGEVEWCTGQALTCNPYPASSGALPLPSYYTAQQLTIDPPTTQLPQRYPPHTKRDTQNTPNPTITIRPPSLSRQHGGRLQPAQRAPGAGSHHRQHGSEHLQLQQRCWCSLPRRQEDWVCRLRRRGAAGLQLTNSQRRQLRRHLRGHQPPQQHPSSDQVRAQKERCTTTEGRISDV